MWREENKLEVAENRVNRWTCGHKILDKIGNEEIRERWKIKSLRVRCKQARLRWSGHLERRDKQHVTETIWNMKLPGRRKRERPRKLKDNIKKSSRD